MKKYVYCLVFAFTAVLFLCLLSACESNDAKPSIPDAYNFGMDKVSSITSVVGERTVTAVESEGENEFPSMQYTYQSNSVSDDLFQYTEFLKEQGWTISGNGYNLQESPGSAQFYKESADEGKILILYITYEKNQYAVKVTKLEAVIGQS